jgi:MSHA pilin protein MshD
MNTAEQNFRLLQEIEANRRFLLMAYQQNPKLLETAELRIKQIFQVRQPLETDTVNSERIGKQRGISLIELIMFMVIISIAVAGVLLVMNKVSGHSADALIRKQALAIAESVLEEVELQDFNPVAANTLVTLANRTSVYHIVSDYNLFTTAGIFSASTMPASAVVGLGNYNLNVAVMPTAILTPLYSIPAASSVLITVTVTDPQGTLLQLSGYRTAYP